MSDLTQNDKKKGNLRDRILETARALFNERGYNEVSMRNIAEALKISVGNLTYHFKRKEDLIEAVITAQHSEYRVPDIPRTLEELDACFKRVLLHQEKNCYYSRHYQQLSQISPKIYEIQRRVLQDLRDLVAGAFMNLIQAKLMKTDEVPCQSENTIQAILTICAYGTVLGETTPIACVWSLIYPLLTENGKKQSPFHSDSINMAIYIP